VLSCRPGSFLEFGSDAGWLQVARRRRLRQACPRLTWVLTLLSPCGGLQRTPALSRSRPPTEASPMTGIWPPEPRRFWHVGPMARSIRDLSLAFSQLAGQDGQDGYASNTISFSLSRVSKLLNVQTHEGTRKAPFCPQRKSCESQLRGRRA